MLSKKRHLFLSALIFLPRTVQACAVCFGGGDSNMIRGFTWGIAILLVLPFLLAGALGGLIVYSVKKNKRHV